MRSFLLLLLLLYTSWGLTMTIKPMKEMCIWESGTIGDQLYASYEITKGEFKNIKVTVLLIVLGNIVDYQQ